MTTSVLLLASVLDLAGTWQLSTPAATNVWDCAIPGDNASALLAAGFIKDPFVKKQEDCVQWLGNCDWKFERSFDVDEATLAKAKVFLEFDSIDTAAEVFLNGTSLGRTENEFRRWRFEVKRLLKAKGNRLAVAVRAPRPAAEANWLKTPDFDIRSWAVTLCREISALRKCQCTFGWDWGVSVPVSGLYYGVRLFGSDGATLDHAAALAQLADDGSATVTFDIGITGEGVPEVTFDGRKLAAPATELRLERPRLWWPNGMGEQNLYSWSVKLGDQEIRGRLGIRRLELVREPDAKGESFGFRVNGKDFFAMGADWIPCDALPAARTAEKMRYLLESSRDAHMNCVRVWGGGVYETDEFYDICDELGLLVWQDFMFACGRYPTRPDFLENIAAEAEYQVKRLKRHPSILLWCGDNECVCGVREPGRFQNDWITWNAVLAKAVKKAAPEAIWWPSSPCAGEGDFSNNEDTGHKGDSHYWGVWHGSRDFSGYYILQPRFCSEFGYQSFMSETLVKRYGMHQKNGGGDEKIDRMMKKYFPAPKDDAERFYLSRVQQALAIETAIAYWRSLWPRCRGTVVWQLNDWWPCASWSSIDYDGRWKPLHYLLRRCYAPDYPSAKRAEEMRTIDYRDLRVAELRAASVTADGDAFRVRLEGAAKLVVVEDPDDPKGRFSDNCVDIGDAAVELVYRPTRPVTAEALAARLKIRGLVK